MKRIAVIPVLLSFSLCALAQKQEKIVFAPQWTPQSQFAGCYVALEKGYYSEVGLDVEIIHPGINSADNSLNYLSGGKVQIAEHQLLSGIVKRADGCPIVNVMQITQKSGLLCVSHEPISNPMELRGRKVGKWKSGFSEFCEIMEVANGISVDWVPFINGINLFVFGAVDAVLCQSYNEYVSLILSVGNIPEENVIKFSDFGYNSPEDALFVTEEFLREHPREVEAFTQATMKGWEYAREHVAEALEITGKYVAEANVVTNSTHQKMMLEDPMLRVILTVAIPMIISSVIDSIYNLADTFFVSGLGEAATAAVAVAPARKERLVMLIAISVFLLFVV